MTPADERPGSLVSTAGPGGRTAGVNRRAAGAFRSTAGLFSRSAGLIPPATTPKSRSAGLSRRACELVSPFPFGRRPILDPRRRSGALSHPRASGNPHRRRPSPPGPMAMGRISASTVSVQTGNESAERWFWGIDFRRRRHCRTQSAGFVAAGSSGLHGFTGIVGIVGMSASGAEGWAVMASEQVFRGHEGPGC
jgi:hypothetical protein